MRCVRSVRPVFFLLLTQLTRHIETCHEARVRARVGVMRNSVSCVRRALALRFGWRPSITVFRMLIGRFPSIRWQIACKPAPALHFLPRPFSCGRGASRPLRTFFLVGWRRNPALSPPYWIFGRKAPFCLWWPMRSQIATAPPQSPAHSPSDKMPVAPAKVANLRIAAIFSQVSHGHAHALRLVPQRLSRDSHDSQTQG